MCLFRIRHPDFANGDINNSDYGFILFGLEETFAPLTEELAL